jgi:hypothetical protein
MWVRRKGGGKERRGIRKIEGKVVRKIQKDTRKECLKRLKKR